MIDEIIESPLSRIAQSLRDILSENTLLQTLLTDTLKPDEPIIKSQPLNFNAVIGTYNVSAYHTAVVHNVDDKSGYSVNQAPIFLDIHKKVDILNGNNVFDDLNNFAFTVLGILYDQDPTKSLNGMCDGWDFFSQTIYPDDSQLSSNIKEKIPQQKTINYFVRICIIVQYTLNTNTYGF